MPIFKIVKLYSSEKIYIDLEKILFATESFENKQTKVTLVNGQELIFDGSFDTVCRIINYKPPYL